MNSDRASNITQQPVTARSRKQLLKRLGCLGSLSIFSSSIAFTQAALSIAPPSVVVTPAPTAADLLPPKASPAPEPVKSEPTPPVAIEIPQSAPVAESPLVKPQAPAAPAKPAAPTYEAPSAVVFSERRSGCEFAVSSGQAVSGSCGKASPTPAKATASKPVEIGNTVSKAIASVMRPQFKPETPTEEAQAEPSSVAATPPAIVPPSFVQNYYNRTIRPLGLNGNGDVRLLFPLSIPATISSLFGWRVHPITGDQRLHTGTDLAAPMGTPVVAALTGRVIMADFFGGYGLAIALEHTNGSQQTLYAHMSEIFVKPGEIISQGTVIGRVGSTGNSTGPHLHFEFRQQTQEGGWIAQDAGLSLEQAAAQLVRSMQVTQQNPTPEQPRS